MRRRTPAADPKAWQAENTDHGLVAEKPTAIRQGAAVLGRLARNSTHSCKALMFEPAKATIGQLISRSVIYGDVSIPIVNIVELQIGDFEQQFSRHVLFRKIRQ